MFVVVIFGLLFVVLLVMSIVLLNGKGAFLISGYNTMSEKEKAKYDEKAYCRFNGQLLLALSFCLPFIAIGIHLEMLAVIYVGTMLTVGISVAGAIYAKGGKRFLKFDSLESLTEEEEEAYNGRFSFLKILNAKTLTAHKGEKFNRRRLITMLVVMPITFIVMGVTFYYGSQEPVVTAFDDRIEIKAMYGLTVPFSEITDISLLNESMRDIGTGRRSGGYSSGSGTLKGNFQSDARGKMRLFVQANSSPTIWIARAGDERDIYISLPNGQETEQLYRDIIQQRGYDSE